MVFEIKKDVRGKVPVKSNESILRRGKSGGKELGVICTVKPLD